MTKRTAPAAAVGLTLAKLSVNQRLSEETLCFSCDLLWNGRKIGEASNRGTGGQTDVYFSGAREDVDAAIASVKGRTFDGPDGIFGDDGKPLPMAFEDVVDEMVEVADHRKRVGALLKRSFKAKTVFVLGDDVWERKQPYTAQVGALVLANHPGAIVLNGLPFEDAIDRYIEVSKRQPREPTELDRRIAASEAASRGG